MPESLDINLDELKSRCSDVIVEKGGKISNTEEQPIAFGLKALVISFAFPEEKEIDDVTNSLSSVEGISSAEMIDYRRAIG